MFMYGNLYVYLGVRAPLRKRKDGARRPGKKLWIPLEQSQQGHIGEGVNEQEQAQENDGIAEHEVEDA